MVATAKYDCNRTPEHRGLLDDVLAAPDDDTPRRILADWLEDDGQIEWATMIRDMLDGREAGFGWKRPAARHCRAWFCPWWPRLIYRRHTLIPTVGFSITGAGRETPPGALTVRRGFSESVRCSLEAWMKYGHDVVNFQPITSVTIGDRDTFVTADFADGSRHLAFGFFCHDVTTGSYRSMWLPFVLKDAKFWPNVTIEGRYVIGFGSFDDAVAALGNACLLWARSVAEGIRS